MQRIRFVKMVAAGNDFVVIKAGHQLPTSGLQLLARKICDRKFGIGADGLLWLESSRKADVRMRIFNADGSEAEMCGNGARCAALFTSQMRKAKCVKLNIETKAGIISSVVKGDNVKIKLTDPQSLKLDISLKAGTRAIRVNSINTGVPHAVVFTEGLQKIDILPLGRALRYHKAFYPRGTNVDFIEPLSKQAIRVRTYERGVEDETLACGTGSVAAALIFALKTKAKNKISVHTQSKEVLKIYFKNGSPAGLFTDVWLEGKAREVYKGEYYV